MKVYKSITMKGISDNQYLILENVQVDIVFHNKEGAVRTKTSKGPVMFGGETYYSIHCFDVASKIKDKYGSQNINMCLDDDDSQNQISNISMQYIGNDVMIKTHKMNRVEYKKV